MTRIEAFRKKYPNSSKLFSDKGVINMICPGELLEGEPDMSFRTVNYNRQNRRLGCRGITCEECWNQEVNDEQT